MSVLSYLWARLAHTVRTLDLSHVQGPGDTAVAAPESALGLVVTLDHGTHLQQHRLPDGHPPHVLFVQGRAWHHVRDDDLGGWIYAPVSPARPGDTGTE